MSPRPRMSGRRSDRTASCLRVATGKSADNRLSIPTHPRAPDGVMTRVASDEQTVPRDEGAVDVLRTASGSMALVPQNKTSTAKCAYLKSTCLVTTPFLREGHITSACSFYNLTQMAREALSGASEPSSGRKHPASRLLPSCDRVQISRALNLPEQPRLAMHMAST